jgi:hypothetical protein
MTNNKFTCHNNCDYENRITFEMVPINEIYATPIVKFVPNQRCCPKCFQLSAYDDKCQMHTCDDCDYTFCFICLRNQKACMDDESHCLPVRQQDYTIFPKTTDV